MAFAIDDEWRRRAADWEPFFAPYAATPLDVRGALEASWTVFLTSSLVALLFSASVWSSLGGVDLAAWTVLSLAIFATGYVGSQRMLRGGAVLASPSVVRRLAWYAVLQATPFALLAIAFLGRSLMRDEMVILIVCAGMAAGGAFALRRVPIAAAAYVYTILASAAIASGVRDLDAFWPLVVYFIPYAIVLTAIAAALGRTAREKDAMIAADALNAAKLRAAQAEIERLACNDGVTGLPNRSVLVERLLVATADVEETRESLALFVVDLHRFQNVNDMFGHEAGDALLAEIGRRIERAVFEADVVARLDSDEFAVLARWTQGPEDAVKRAKAVLKALSGPIQLDGGSVDATASLGVALFPRDAKNPKELLRRAEIALRRAKRLGPARIAIFDEGMAHAVSEAETLERDLRTAIREGALEVRYQPKVDLRTGLIVGGEALLRWPHPTRGFIAPPTFLSVAEEHGLITKISEHVFDRLLGDFPKFRANALRPISIAVNIHPVDLTTPEFLFEQVSRLRMWGIGADEVVFEITEGCVVGDGADLASLTIENLHADGVTLSLDDFGTGHASLSHLKRLPVRELKVDKEFVRGVCDDPMDRAIVAAAIEITKCAGLSCVAEGVETEAQRAALVEMGCRIGQGFLFSPAVDAATFAELARRPFMIAPPFAEASHGERRRA